MLIVRNHNKFAVKQTVRIWRTICQLTTFYTIYVYVHVRRRGRWTVSSFVLDNSLSPVRRQSKLWFLINRTTKTFEGHSYDIQIYYDMVYILWNIKHILLMRNYILCNICNQIFAYQNYVWCVYKYMVTTFCLYKIFDKYLSKCNKANLRDLIAATGLVILLKLDSNRRFFSPGDLEIWWMTSKNNRAPLLYFIKFCASFQSHRWIQT